MPDLVAGEYREPPERVNRITRSGADQYVLACNARRDAGPASLAIILKLERGNSELRRELAWTQVHGASFTARWIGGRLVLSLYVVAIAASLGFWLFSPNGRSFRVSLAAGAGDVHPGTGASVERGFVTQDMTQHEIDSIATVIRTNLARRHVRD